jgi:hypothetical protein
VRVPVGFETRSCALRPYRLGTRRKLGGSRREAASSLDTEKQLETTVPSSDHRTVKQFLCDSLTEEDHYRRQMSIHRVLEGTVRKIWQGWANKGNDPESRAWAAAYDAQLKTRDDEDEGERRKRLKQWLKDHKARGAMAERLKWERAFEQIRNCRTQWIGYGAACCGDKTGTIAVPIGCKHRLCPLCAWDRSKNARLRIKRLFDRLTHPVLITLTIPNKDSIRKHDFTLFRQRVRKFLAQHRDVLGGVYSIETTYNRQEKSWHIHAHVLADLNRALPVKRDKVMFYGEKTMAFTALKWGLEFDWLCLWVDTWAKMPSIEAPKKGVKKWAKKWAEYEFAFAQWVGGKRRYSTKWAKTFDGARWVLRRDLTPDEQRLYKKQESWNRHNTRVIDIRPVTDRDGAVKEVLKYITKSGDFADCPEAVEQFCNAVKGARLVQTFGTWYGFDVESDTEFDPENFKDWGEFPPCSCGLNHWERVGVFYRPDVRMDSSGRWFVTRSFSRHDPGTVTRPTIRALQTCGGENHHAATEGFCSAGRTEDGQV